MRWGHPSAISTPLWITIFLSMSNPSIRGPLGNVLLTFFCQLVELLHKPPDLSHLAGVLKQAIVNQVEKQNVHVCEPPELVRRAVLYKVADDPLFQVAVSAVDQNQVQLVNLHRLPVDLPGVVPRMTRWAERDQVVERVRLALGPRQDVGEFHGHLAAGWDGTPVPALDQDCPLQLRRDRWPL